MGYNNYNYYSNSHASFPERARGLKGSESPPLRHAQSIVGNGFAREFPHAMRAQNEMSRS